MEDGSTDGVRADKWLWAARLFKTRSLATAACHAGHVKLAGASIKAARLLRPGDELDVVTPGGRKLVIVLALAERRGPAAQARTLYDDKTPPAPPARSLPPPVLRDPGLGRPSKRERRELQRLRGRD